VASILDFVLRMGEGRTLRKLESLTRAVNALEDAFSSLTDEELRQETADFRQRFAAGETLDNMLP
jgi:preprotein translocase subunit SecA